MLVVFLVIYFITMTKKHYKMIATWFIHLHQADLVDVHDPDYKSLLRDICVDLKQDNPKFDKEKFLSFIENHAN